MAGHARYTVLQKIADGGMAEIYLGTAHGAEGFHRPIVIKRIRGVLSVDPKFRNMLVDEAHIAMSLVHSNIAQVLDLGTARGSDYLVLELVDGWDLHQLLNRSRACDIPLPPALAMHVMIETCRGLAYAHTRRRDGKLLGIVHRDVSPHNVLVSEQGEVKLTDFGIASAFHKREQTLAGTVKGKLGFMSPEQARGEPLDHRSDIFSVGTTLYVLVTGKRPYSATTDLEILLRMQQADFPPPESVRPDLAPEVVAILHKAMQKAPEDRYQSAEDLLVDLERVQRAVYGPAGQTELKRWLASLTERDGVLPTSLRPPKPAPEKQQPASEIPKGSEIMLEEVEPDAMLSSGVLPAVVPPAEPPAPPPPSAPPVEPAPAAAPPAAIAAPAPLEAAAPSPEPPAPVLPPSLAPTSAPAHALSPDPRAPSSVTSALQAVVATPPRPAPTNEPAPAPAAAPGPSVPTWSVPPDPSGHSPLVHFEPTFVDELPGQGSLKRNALILAMGAAILAVLAWWLAPVAPGLVGMVPTVDASAAAAATAGARDAAATPVAVSVAAAGLDAGAPQIAAAGAGAVESLDAGAGEGSGEGAEENVDAGATGVASGGAVPEGVDAGEAGEGAEAGDTVSVRFVTTPPGASVTVQKQTYGATPINVRFKAELIYDVVLSKQGYQTIEKKLYVPRRKGQVFTFTLEKKKWWQL